MGHSVHSVGSQKDAGRRSAARNLHFHALKQNQVEGVPGPCQTTGPRGGGNGKPGFPSAFEGWLSKGGYFSVDYRAPRPLSVNP